MLTVDKLLSSGGLETEKEYPYDGEDEKCKFSVGDVTVYINGSVNISSNEAGMHACISERVSKCHTISMFVSCKMPDNAVQRSIVLNQNEVQSSFVALQHCLAYF